MDALRQRCRCSRPLTPLFSLLPLLLPLLLRLQGMEEVTRMQSIVDLGSDSEAPARLLVASVRDAEELAALAAEGCNTFTVSPEVAQQLFAVKLTVEAAAVFQQHAEEMGAERVG